MFERLLSILAAGCALTLLAFGRQTQERQLFDGRTLDGWEGDPRYWSVEDGAIVGRSTEAVPCGTTTYLLWRGGEVSDFELELDFQLVGGNSGVQFRSALHGVERVAGYQADLEDGRDWSGCFYEQDGRGVIARRGEVVRFESDGERVVLQVGDGAKLLESFRPRAWNRYRVVARGATFASSINGVPMSTVTDLDAARAARRGGIALQLHSGPPMEVRFRDLRLVELVASDGRDSAATPQWIWTRAEARNGARDGEEAFFRRELTIAKRVKSARLTASADNSCAVLVDGETVLEHDDWAAPIFVDVAAALDVGEHVVAVFAKNEGDPAGFQLALDVEHEDGTRERIVSDGAWLAHEDPDDGWDERGFDARSWKHAAVLAPLGEGPWLDVDEPKAASASAALPAAQIELLQPGFFAELLYTVPRVKQGSWVAMCFDDRGRIVAADQYGPLYRVTLADGAVADVERLPLELGRAQGLCYAFGALYVVVAEGDDDLATGLWRAKHDPATDRWSEPELLKSFDGSGEHGPHAVVLGPDRESLYVVGGNHTALPDGIARFRVPRNWGEDRLLPERADPNGHAVGITAPGGWVCKTDRDGEQWELVACGLRNSYDLAFDARGEAFTFDSDMEWDIGLPWYRAPMIAHVVSGADFGWRTGSWRWPSYYLDSLPGLIDLGVASPTGMCVDALGKFAPELATSTSGALFAADWAYGTIYAIRLSKKDEIYAAEAMPFAKGKPLAVTDLEFGPDGRLYFLVGGRRTQSALYRISARDDRSRAESPVPADPTRCLDSHKSVQQFHGWDVGDVAVDAAFARLDDRDRTLRYAARVALESQDPTYWIPRALAERRPRAAIECIVALARCAPAELRERVLAKLDVLALEWLDEEQLLAALRALQLVLIRMGEPDADRAWAVAERLDSLYPSASKLANRELAQLLVYLEHPAVVAKSLDLIERGATQEDQIAIAWPLRTLASGWTLDDRRRYFAWIDGTASRLSGGASFSKYLDDLRADAVATFGESERAELADLIEKPEASPAAASAPVARPFVRAWTVDELLPKLGRARSGRDFERGRSAFVAARCLECHRIAGDGGSLGPDLGGASNRFGDRDLLEALIEPSKAISDQYQDTAFLTVDERQFIGRAIASDATKVVIQLADDPTATVELARDEIELQRPHAISRMPRALLDVLTEDEILDLLAYLRAGGDREDGAFR